MQQSPIINWLRVGTLLQQLESLYNQVFQSQSIVNTSPGLGNRSGSLPQGRPATFSETMEEIRVFLKILSGAQLTKEEDDIMESVIMQDYLHWFQLEHYIDKYIQWLTNNLQ